MTLYEIAFVFAAVLFFALVFMQIMMRQQVHRARFGNQEISPGDVRFSNNLFGQDGIWILHKRTCGRSALRFSFLAVSFALSISLIVGLCDLLYVRHGL